MASQHVRKCLTRSSLTPATILDSFLSSLLPPFFLLRLTSTQMWPEKTETEKLFLLVLSLHFPQYLPSDFIFKQQQSSFFLPLSPRPPYPPPQQAMLFYARCPVGIILMVDSQLGICLVFILCFALLSRNGNCFSLSLPYFHSSFLAFSPGQSPLLLEH